MARPCASCSHPKKDEIDRKLKAGVSFADVARWLVAEGHKPITSQSIGTHAKTHLGIASVVGRRPFRGRLLEALVETVEDGLESGDLSVTVKDGIRAQDLLDKRADRDADRDFRVKVALLLSGAIRPQLLPPPDPALEAIEGEFQELLNVSP